MLSWSIRANDETVGRRPGRRARQRLSEVPGTSHPGGLRRSILVYFYTASRRLPLVEDRVRADGQGAGVGLGADCELEKVGPGAGLGEVHRGAQIVEG